MGQCTTHGSHEVTLFSKLPLEINFELLKNQCRSRCISYLPWSIDLDCRQSISGWEFSGDIVNNCLCVRKLISPLNIPMEGENISFLIILSFQNLRNFILLNKMEQRRQFSPISINSEYTCKILERILQFAYNLYCNVQISVYHIF